MSTRKSLEKMLMGKEGRSSSKKTENMMKGHFKKRYDDGGMVGGTPDQMNNAKPSDLTNMLNTQRISSPGVGPYTATMKKGGRTEKYAMGGAGKIRHGEMTKDGMPKKTRKGR